MVQLTHYGDLCCDLSAPGVAIFLRLQLRLADTDEKIAAIFCSPKMSFPPRKPISICEGDH